MSILFIRGFNTDMTSNIDESNHKYRVFHFEIYNNRF